MLNPHKIWKVSTTTLLLMLTIQFTLMGFFKQKAILENKTAVPVDQAPSDRKVIMLLVDALREDFVDFGANTTTTLSLDPNASYAYRGPKLTLFKEMRDKYPDRAVLFPAKSAMPTVTVVRVKNVITGGISTIFETTNEFIQHEVNEDNIFYQVKNNDYVGADDRILFYGDHCWVPYFKSHFDEYEEFATADTRDVDTLDVEVDKLILD